MLRATRRQLLFGSSREIVTPVRINGSSLRQVRPDPQRAASDVIAESVEVSKAEAEFDRQRRTVLRLLDFDPETPTVIGGYDGEHGVAGLFAQLLMLSDSHVLSAVAMLPMSLALI